MASPPGSAKTETARPQRDKASTATMMTKKYIPIRPASAADAARIASAVRNASAAARIALAAAPGVKETAASGAANGAASGAASGAITQSGALAVAGAAGDVASGAATGGGAGASSSKTATTAASAAGFGWIDAAGPASLLCALYNAAGGYWRRDETLSFQPALGAAYPLAGPPGGAPAGPCAAAQQRAIDATIALLARDIPEISFFGRIDPI